MVVAKFLLIKCKISTSSMKLVRFFKWSSIMIQGIYRKWALAKLNIFTRSVHTQMKLKNWTTTRQETNIQVCGVCEVWRR